MINKNTNEKVYRNLIKHYGINKHTAQLILYKLGFSKNTKLAELNMIEIEKLNNFISYLRNLKNFDSHTIFKPIDDNLKILNSFYLNKILNSHSYKGSRIFQGYPANGQRTRTNAQNSKKRKKKNNLKSIKK